MEQGLIDELYFRKFRYGSGGGGGGDKYTTFTGSLIQFTAPKAHAFKSVKVFLEESASGYTEVSVYLEEEYDAYAEPIATVVFPYRIYGGSFDLISGIGEDENGNQFTAASETLFTLQGNNIIWSDGDSLSVEAIGTTYPSDIVGIGIVGTMILKS